MKKIFTLIASIIAFSSFSQAPTTCSLDPAFVASNKNGIWPDSATNFVQAYVGQPYGQNITVKIPKDTLQGFIKICFNRFEVSTPGSYTNFNLPPGLNFLAGPTVTNTSGTFKFPGNANSCAVISGTPTTAGTYTVQFRVVAYGTPTTASGTCPASPNVNGGSAVNSTTLSYYVIQVNPPAAISENVNSKSFDLVNVPNPVSSKTSIRFHVNDEALAKLKVYNILGDKIFEDKFRTNVGDNSYELNVSDWNSGIYLYSIQYKNYTESKRMVVNSTH